jgi:hypothetical protein
MKSYPFVQVEFARVDIIHQLQRVVRQGIETTASFKSILVVP